MTALDTVVAARRQLHAVAENLIAGPQYRLHGSIRLAARPDGFSATAMDLAVRELTLVLPSGGVALAGPVSAVVAALGRDPGPPPAAVYRPSAPLPPDAVLDIDPDAARFLYRALFAGHRAVSGLAAGAQPVLWPEHFDVGAAIDEVNYGVSPGDDHHELPYAYVGPWRPRRGPFWNAPFGALMALDGSADTETLTAAITDFFGRAASLL